MRSIRAPFIILEALTVLSLLLLSWAVLARMEREVLQDSLKARLDDAAKLDLILENYLEEKRQDFSRLLSSSDRYPLLPMVPFLADLYRIDRNGNVREILRRAPDSGIFPGYDLTDTAFGQFFQNNLPSGDKVSISALIRSGEEEEPSVYLIGADQDGWLVGRIGMKKIQEALNLFAGTSGKILAISSRDGYVLLASHTLDFQILPPARDQILSIEGKDYACTRIGSRLLENDLVLLTPTEPVERFFAALRGLAIPFFSLVLLLTVAKLVWQTLRIVRPLGMFSTNIASWKVGQSRTSLPPALLQYRELANLQTAFDGMVDHIEETVEKVRESESRIERIQRYLQTIIDCMPSALIAVDDDGTVTEWNQAASILTGCSSADALGHVFWEAAPMLLRYREPAQEVILSGNQQELSREAFGIRDPRYLKASLFPIAAAGFSGLAIRLDDETELEKADQKLRQAQKMETIGTLAGGLAHDFNNVLAGILGPLSLLRHGLSLEDFQKQEDLEGYLNLMEDSANRARDMVAHLLALAHRHEINIVATDLSRLIANVLKICASSFEKCVEIRDDLPYERAVTMADATQFEQVLLNLCVNAYHSMTSMRPEHEKQGGILTVSLRSLQADNGFCRSHPEAKEGEYWVISVEDTGVGMDARTRSRIFDPFFSTKAKGEGTGLGLTMAYNIIHQHSGFLDVYSEPGIGSRFSVYLPLLKTTESAPHHREPAPLPALSGTVLVVDDENAVREIARRILETCGLKVLIASDGEEGIQEFIRHREELDAVLLDLVMPKKSGVEVFEAIQRLSPNVPVLISSGYRQDERVEGLIQKGAKGFVQKPYTMDGLARALAEALETGTPPTGRNGRESEAQEPEKDVRPETQE